MRAWILTLSLSAACVRPSKVVGVACDSATDCVLGDVTGQCESTGYCSYPDATCPGGQRYSPGAGDDLGGSCVGGATECGGKDGPCCGSVCGANLACNEASLCVCGGDDEPCCGGNTCGANLTCGEDARCACGGIGEACCGGSTCDAGLSCGAGTCNGGATKIVVGSGHACALRPDQTVWCWGSDYKPWPTTTPGLLIPTLGSLVPKRMALTNVVDIRAAEMHTCAKKADGTLWCWGHNESGQLGNDTTTSSAIPTQVTGLTNVTAFDGGRHHTCAVGSYLGTPGMWCWGRNGHTTRWMPKNPDTTLGRLGNNSIADSKVPVAVDLSAATQSGQTVKAIATGSYHTCAVMSDDKAWCWGEGGNGQLGNGAASNTTVPVQVTFTVPSGATIDEITCSDGSGYKTASTCMRLATGAVYCWGIGGELGDGSTAQRNAPGAPVTTTGLGTATFTQLASAANVHCGLTSAGEVWCWGGNTAGVLGINDEDEGATRTTPAKTGVLTGAVQLDMSHRTACAVDGQGQVWCWGTNRRGVIRGADSRVLQPTKVPL